MNRLTRAALIVVPAAIVVAVGWQNRRAILDAIAEPESDYTETFELEEGYGRPGADLSPVWRVPLEPGYGGAAIDGDEVFVLDREIGVGDTLRVLDLTTGEPRWSFRYDDPGRLPHAGSRTTPAVTADRVILCSNFGRVHCVDRPSQELAWTRDLRDDVGGRLPDFGFAASPLVVGEVVVLPAHGEDVGLVALDVRTGDVRWTTEGLGFSHSEPVLLDLLGETHLVFLSGREQGDGKDAPAPTIVSGFDPSSGELLWRVEPMLTSVPVPPAVRVDDERLFVTGGYAGGSILLRIERAGDGFALTEEFRTPKGAQLHPPVVHGGHVYLLANENANDSRRRRGKGGLCCFDLDGNELWTTGADPYLGRGHMLLLGQHILIQDGLSGFLRFVRASPEGYDQVLAANVFDSPPKERRRMWARMANRNGAVVVRGERELLCVLLGGRPPGFAERPVDRVRDPARR